jgi:hypothetical protein
VFTRIVTDRRKVALLYPLATSLARGSIHSHTDTFSINSVSIWLKPDLSLATFYWYVTMLEVCGNPIMGPMRMNIWLIDWWFIVFNATFSNISAISWRPVLDSLKVQTNILYSQYYQKTLFNNYIDIVLWSKRKSCNAMTSLYIAPFSGHTCF